MRRWRCGSQPPGIHAGSGRIPISPSSRSSEAVLQYMRANGYKTYIISGGGQDFVRVYAEQVLRHLTRSGRRLHGRNKIWLRQGRRAWS